MAMGIINSIHKLLNITGNNNRIIKVIKMIMIESVARKHPCNDCHKILSPLDDRIYFYGGRYCIFCGYKKIIALNKECEQKLYEVKERFGKEIVIEKLTANDKT